jgi:transposase
MVTNFDENYAFSKRKRGHIGKAMILKIVKEVERGVPRWEVVEKFKVSKSSIADWMRDYGSPRYHIRKQKLLSQAEKTSMLRGIVDGRMTVRDAMISYRVSSSTVRAWIKSYKREKGELASAMTTKNSSEGKQSAASHDEQMELLKKALLESQQHLQDANLKIQALNTLIDVAEDEFKIAIRKKAGAKRS